MHENPAAALEGGVAIITGASSGIGRATALALALEARMRVTITARRTERLETLAREITDRGGEVLVAPADVTDEEALRQVFERSHAHWRRLDVLINNAGLGLDAPFSAPDRAASAEAWRTMWLVNVHALAVAASEALAHFDALKGGHIVNIGSMAGHRVPPRGGFYAATKFAVRGLTEALRKELREADNPSRVSMVSPGFVETEFFEVLSGDPSATAAETARHAVLEPEDVARVILRILTEPPHVEIHDVLMRPTPQPL